MGNDRRARAARGRHFTDEELQDLVASTDSGARAPSSRWVALLISGTALLWSLFPALDRPAAALVRAYLPVLNSSQTRPIHLMFAIFLAFLAYPALKRSPRHRVPAHRLGPRAHRRLLLLLHLLVLRHPRHDRPVGPADRFPGRARRRRPCRAAGGLPPRPRPRARHRGLAVPRLCLFRDRLADPRTDRTRRTVLHGAHQRPVARHGGGLRHPSRRLHGLRLPIRALRLALDKAGAGNYFIQLAFAALGHLRGGLRRPPSWARP
jgi:hypothetical protein